MLVNCGVDVDYRVKNKMEKGDGMSFAEFSYPLLQGWDWWHMFANHDVQLQVGGSDQYGNIIAGMDAIKHIAQISPESLEGKGLLDASGKLKNEVLPMGITVPLLTTASGEKFGKSAGNAIWLDKNLTSPFDLYGVSFRCNSSPIQSKALLTHSPKVPASLIRCRRRPLPRPFHLRAFDYHREHHGRPRRGSRKTPRPTPPGKRSA